MPVEVIVVGTISKFKTHLDGFVDRKGLDMQAIETGLGQQLGWNRVWGKGPVAVLFFKLCSMICLCPRSGYTLSELSHCKSNMVYSQSPAKPWELSSAMSSSGTVH